MLRPIKVILSLGMLCAIYFLLPFIFGVMTQHYSTQFLKNENDTLGKVLGVRLHFASYDRGWFQSKAELQIERKNGDGAWKVFRDIPIHIKHGPSIMVENRRVAGIGMISVNDIALDDKSPYKFDLHEILSVNGERGTIVLLKNPATTTADNLSVSALRVHVASNLKADQFRFSVAAKNLHFYDPQNTVSFDTGNMDLNLIAHYLQDRHWQMTAGTQLSNDTVSFLLSKDPTSKIALHANFFGLSNLHFDTKEIAKLLGELAQIKDASDAQQTISPSTWMALFQQLLVQVIHDDTTAIVQGVSVKTPMGELHLHYDIAFPTLPKTHDYFDIATRGVGKLDITIPHWDYLFVPQNRQLTLNDLQYTEKNNTVFSRHSQLSLGALDLTNASITSTPVFYFTGLLYNGILEGNFEDLSQLMDWKISKLCFSKQCFNQLNGDLKFKNMNFMALRDIAKATQQLVQYAPEQKGNAEVRWIDVGSAYAKLISANTSVSIAHQMQTPKGLLQITGNLSWPGLQINAPKTDLLSTVLNQSVYQMHLQFPSSYLDNFLDEMRQAKLSQPASPQASTVKSSEPSMEMQMADFLQYAIQQGYLKKTQDAYFADLSGKGTAFTINGVAWKAPE